MPVNQLTFSQKSLDEKTSDVLTNPMVALSLDNRINNSNENDIKLVDLKIWLGVFSENVKKNSDLSDFAFKEIKNLGNDLNTKFQNTQTQQEKCTKSTWKKVAKQFQEKNDQNYGICNSKKGWDLIKKKDEMRLKKLLMN